jgi:hypothetical protein
VTKRIFDSYGEDLTGVSEMYTMKGLVFSVFPAVATFMMIRSKGAKLAGLL